MIISGNSKNADARNKKNAVAGDKTYCPDMRRKHKRRNKIKNNREKINDFRRIYHSKYINNRSLTEGEEKKYKRFILVEKKCDKKNQSKIAAIII